MGNNGSCCNTIDVKEEISLCRQSVEKVELEMECEAVAERNRGKKPIEKSSKEPKTSDFQKTGDNKPKAREANPELSKMLDESELCELELPPEIQLTLKRESTKKIIELDEKFDLGSIDQSNMLKLPHDNGEAPNSFVINDLSNI